MSYICQKTGVVVPNNVPEHKIVIETRPKTYEKYIRRGRNKGTYETIHGFEIVKEMRVCPDIYTQMTGLPPKKAVNAGKTTDTIRVDNKPVEPWRNRKKKYRDHKRRPDVQRVSRPKR